jgi:Mlc titration factor MtfA (ptsG expression regulator)
LVFFGADGKPAELLAVLAEQLYPKAEMLPSSYEVRFDRREFYKTAE